MCFPLLRAKIKYMDMSGKRGRAGRQAGAAPGSVVTRSILEWTGAVASKDIAPRVFNDQQEGAQLPFCHHLDRDDEAAHK
jgi:hypothetical protein